MNTTPDTATRLASALVRVALGVGLTAIVFGQMGISPVAALVIAFLLTVVCTPKPRRGVN